MRQYVKFLLRLSLLAALAGPAHGSEGVALWGTPKHQDGFAHFDYVNPDAPKGGTLKLANPATFDSVNPFLLKGVAAPGVQGYVFQSLMTQSYDEPQSVYPLIAESIDIAPPDPFDALPDVPFSLPVIHVAFLYYRRAQ